jgi:hypothetical protein
LASRRRPQKMVGPGGCRSLRSGTLAAGRSHRHQRWHLLRATRLRALAAWNVALGGTKFLVAREATRGPVSARTLALYPRLGSRSRLMAVRPQIGGCGKREGCSGWPPPAKMLILARVAATTARMSAPSFAFELRMVCPMFGETEDEQLMCCSLRPLFSSCTGSGLRRIASTLARFHSRRRDD